MEDYKKDGNFSAEGRRLRPRKKVGYGEQQSSGEHRGYNSRSNGERRSYGEGGERRSYGENGERRSFNSGERRSYNNGGERRSYGEGGERRSFNNGERRSYGNGEHRSFNNGEHRSYSNGGERRSYGEGGERRSFNNGERRSYGNGEHRSFNGGQRRGFGGNNGGRSFGKPQGRPGFKKRPEYQFNEIDEAGINTMISSRPAPDMSNYSDNDSAATGFKEEIRLNKFIANSGVCSRREADTYIQAGVVTVNGEVVTELGVKVNVITDDIRFNGERLKGEEKVYIVMNKPKGFVTTASDPHADRTVMDLLKDCPSRVFPVGRLDKNTTGVLMFTNDGEIAEKLTHPSYDKKKIYQVFLDHELTQEDFDKILSGITLTDGDIAADALSYTDANDIASSASKSTRARTASYAASSSHSDMMYAHLTEFISQVLPRRDSRKVTGDSSTRAR